MGISSGQRPTRRKDSKKMPRNVRNADVETNSIPTDLGLFYPSGDIALKAIIAFRFCAAIWSNISDCDETYNYWEPTHYLLFGKGFQTWEYSPEFALRSYMYLLVHVTPAWIYHKVLEPNRVFIFYFTRCLFAILCSLCEVYFYKGVCREFGVHVGRLMLAFLLFSAGMFISSTAFLPSAFSMYMCMVSMGAWYHRKYELAVFTTALSSFLSWPFSALLGVPIAIDMLFRRRQIIKFFQWSLMSTAVILIPMVLMDSSYFGRLVVAPYNIIKYNVFTSHGPDLYGTEPWTFYFINGFLNFNVVFVGALAMPLILVCVALFVPSKPRNSGCLPYYLSLLPLYLWIAIFFLQPHKEERFLFPVYPLFCLCGALAVDCCQKLWFCFFINKRNKSVNHYLFNTTPIMVIAILLSSVLSISRIAALYKGYHAPLNIFAEFNSLSAEPQFSRESDINVCVGKEWYRFPSNFFLPSNNWQLRFLRSEFRGQLPQPYSPFQNGTTIIPLHMNDLNQEEPTRYFNIDKCHFLVDLDLGTYTEREPNYSQDKEQWVIHKSIPFLNAAKSHKFYRAFYVPYFSDVYCTYSPFNLLISSKLQHYSSSKKRN